ncbi:alpha-amylase family glycosyl hydrolase [Seohaeicola zhoushanensis]|uniref:Putative alpha-glucosidase n=1 Tax=Seohaeicola zhoushanensis TaxID=1569283 RepID=A0A8J3MCG3_9RHOB|nr:alpha-amylase family glycosyl hydrolase [Seohaeicola zhoushanensis]GHF74324.1 putative alpha-glucosidase [Seohaeicola zhoushanensis]
MSTERTDQDRDWWRGCVIYQIYPRSFQDANADGIGDLRGIVERMPYLASLGVDAIWISPFYTSPMKDFGYDVSDFCDVDPIFGTLADFDAVVAAAHEHGLRVMIDLVLSHTSDQHAWFTSSRAAREGPHADWYVWSDPRPDGTPPNNWLSIFGGPAWHWEPRREQYFLHNFLTSQPDLNLHSEAVQSALLGVMRFWLDRGVQGFRLDTVNFYFCDRELRDNPPLPPEQRNAILAPSVNPYNYQSHIHSKNQPENLDFLARLRRLLDEYPGATSLGEIGDAQRGLELIGLYTTGTRHLHMCYAFEFLAQEPLSAARVAEVLYKADHLARDGWVTWAFSNHDVMRHASRWGLSPAAQRLCATLLLCLPGSACLYQGEELGLGQADLAFEDIQDPYGKEFWPEYKGRDGCRTPMVWTGTERNGGFTEGDPWLPISQEHLRHAVDIQESEPGAILHHYRRALAFRAAHPALRSGRLDGVYVYGDVLHFRTATEAETLYCAFNMSDTPSTHNLPTGDWEIIGQELGAVSMSRDGMLHMGPWQVCIARQANAPLPEGVPEGH